MSQISELIEKERLKARRDIKAIGMLGALLMALVLILILYMLSNQSMFNWVFLALLIPIVVVLMVIIYKFDKATDWLENIDNWFQESKKEYENKKRNQD